MLSGHVAGTLGDPAGPLKTNVFLNEFIDFQDLGNIRFSVFPGEPGGEPGSDM